MTFDCPHCQQNIEVDDAGAGLTVECPTCHQPIKIPKPAGKDAYNEPHRSQTAGPEQPPANAPPMHVPLQPVAADASASLVKKKSSSGCLKFVLFVVMIGAAAFGYAMYRWQQSPQQTWNRLLNSGKRFVREQFGPARTPAAEEALKPAPVPRRPDPIAWLITHKEYWPQNAILQKPVEFPAVSKGKVVGSLVVPAGAEVKVDAITQEKLAAEFMGGMRNVAIDATDLRARAEVELSKSEAAAKRGIVLTPSVPPMQTQAPPSEQTEKIIEASREQVRSGLGALYTHQATTFRVFAPVEKAVSVVLYDSATGNEGRSVYELQLGQNGSWDATLRVDLLGKFYTYLLDRNDSKRAREILDPYATNSVANSTRARITPMTEPVAAGPALDSPTDAIIYEMHVRDFTIDPNSGVKNGGFYLGWTESGTRLPDDSQIKTGLDHLSELGVTHVELMPIQDFENDETSGAYNWGYITTDFFSPEGMYATNPYDNSRARELKSLVKALHSRGIGVIMDVVYNHTSGNCSLMSIAPDSYYRRAANGSFANGSGCGNEVKSEAPMAHRLILDSLKFWVKEYGIDGFRFDLMALIDQQTMREVDRELRQIHPGIILFGEPWTDGSSPLRDKTDKSAIWQMPIGAFNDDFRNALKGAPDGNEPGWIENGSKSDALKKAMLVSDWFAAPTQSINYMTCHDNLVLWDKLQAAMPNATDKLRIETMKLGYLALLTSQGVPFMHGGEEFARTKGGDNNSYQAPDSVNEVDWELKREHIDLFNYVRDVVALRKAHPLFRLRTKSEVRARVNFIATPDRNVLMFTVNGEGVPGETWKRACVVLNSADNGDAEIHLPEGQWSTALAENGGRQITRVFGNAANADEEDGKLTASPTTVSGKIRVRYKSGVVLFER